MKNQVFEKKRELSNEKKLEPYFFSHYRTWKNRETTFYKSPQGILTIIVQKISSFFRDIRGR